MSGERKYKIIITQTNQILFTSKEHTWGRSPWANSSLARPPDWMSSRALWASLMLPWRKAQSPSWTIVRLYRICVGRSEWWMVSCKIGVWSYFKSKKHQTPNRTDILTLVMSYMSYYNSMHFQCFFNILLFFCFFLGCLITLWGWQVCMKRKCEMSLL